MIHRTRSKGPHIFLGFLLAAALTSPAFAANVCILVAETGEGAGQGRLPREQQEAGFESSLLWETCLLDVLFEAGHIVSNAPVLGLGGIEEAGIPGSQSPFAEFPGELEAELAEARAGGADYFILALLRYPAVSDRKTWPERVSLRVYDMRPYRFLYEETGTPARPESETGQARRLIRGLIPHIEG